jgi:hypothetical protein
VALLDYVNLLGWLLFAGTLMLILANGRPSVVEHSRGQPVARRRINLTESSAGTGLRFWAGLVGGIGVALAAIWIPMPTASAVRLVVTLMFGAAALRFAILEQRALNP